MPTPTSKRKRSPNNRRQGKSSRHPKSLNPLYQGRVPQQNLPQHPEDCNWFPEKFFQDLKYHLVFTSVLPTKDSALMGHALEDSLNPRFEYATRAGYTRKLTFVSERYPGVFICEDWMNEEYLVVHMERIRNELRLSQDQEYPLLVTRETPETSHILLGHAFSAGAHRSAFKPIGKIDSIRKISPGVSLCTNLQGKTYLVIQADLV